MDDVAEYADRVFVMNRGAVLLEGTPKEVYCRHGKELKEVGLDLPSGPAFLEYLGQRGLHAERDKLTFEETAEELIKLIQARGIKSS